jgi:hypothetical protein
LFCSRWYWDFSIQRENFNGNNEIVLKKFGKSKRWAHRLLPGPLEW